MDPEEQVPPSALAVPPPCVGGPQPLGLPRWTLTLTCRPQSRLSLLPRSGDMGILLSPPLFPPWFYGCYPFGALPPPLALFMMPPLTRMGVSWPWRWHSSPTKATKSSMTLAPILPSIVGPWACRRRQSSPSTAFLIISSHQVWSSCWSCVPRLQPTPNLWAQCSC
jgi:hypothetical protein